MKFLDEHIKNVLLGIVAFLVAYWIVKFVGVTIDTGFWLLFIILVLIYFELWDLSKRK